MSSACSCWPKLDSLNGVSFSWDDRQGQEGSGSWDHHFRGHQLKQKEENNAVEKALRWDSEDVGLHWSSVWPAWMTLPSKEDHEGMFAYLGVGGLSFPWTGSGKCLILPGESYKPRNLQNFLWRAWFFQPSLYKARVGVSVRIALWEAAAPLTPLPQGKPTLSYKVAHPTSVFSVLRDCRVLSLTLLPNKFVIRSDIFPYFWRMTYLGVFSSVTDRTSYPAPRPLFCCS